MNELLACYWTLAGAYVFGEDDSSPWDFRARAEAAGRAGYRGFGFKQADLRRTLERYRYAEIAGILADNGLRHIELEALFDWCAEGPARQRSDADRHLLLQAAEALGAHHIKAAGDFAGADWSTAQMHDAFQTLAAQAHAAGSQFTLEPIAFSNIPNLDSALAVIGESLGRGGALMLDSWHVTRGHMSLARIAALPAGAIGGVELNDGSLAEQGSALEDTLQRRRLPGEGEFDLHGLIAAARASGFDGPWGVEILSQAHRQLSLDEAAQRSCAAASRLFDSASSISQQQHRRNPMSDIEARVRLLEDQEALKRLFHEYLFKVDSLSDLDGMLALFTEDVVFDLEPIGLPCLHGHAGLRDFFGEVFGYMSHHAHFGCNFSVRELDGDRASAWAYVIGSGVRDGVPVTLHVKYFLDYRRTAQGWKINAFSEAPLLPMPDSLQAVHAERRAQEDAL